MKVKDFLAVVAENAKIVLFEHINGYDEPVTNTMCADQWRELGLFDNRTIELIEPEQDGTIWMTLEALNDD